MFQISNRFLIFKDCFILDTASSGVYVWVGKKGTTQEKVESLKRAQAFIKENNYPAWTRVRKIIYNIYLFKFQIS